MMPHFEITRRLHSEVSDPEKVMAFLKKMTEIYGQEAMITWLKSFTAEEEWPRLVESKKPDDNKEKLAS